MRWEFRVSEYIMYDLSNIYTHVALLIAITIHGSHSNVLDVANIYLF